MEDDPQSYFLTYRLPLIISVLVLVIIQYVSYTLNYWKKRNVPSIKPGKIFGNFTGLFNRKQCTAEISWDLHKELKSKGHKFGGIYFMQTPVFMPIDPAVIKQILSSDFDHFSERGVYFNESKDPLAAHLFNLPTEPWRKLRAKLTPTFTSGKIKMMFETMVKCSDDIVEACSARAGSPIDINDLTIRYAVDIIGSCAFGIDCNSLTDPDDKFKKIADRIVDPPLWNGLKGFLSLISPNILKLGNCSIMEDVVRTFFLDVIKQTMDYREQNQVERNDALQLLINMKNNDEKLGVNGNDMKMTWKLVAAQAFVFFVAGFETSSMTINLCLFELARHPQIQDKVRAEIQRVMKENDGKITYENLKSMTYLDQVIQETLRKYPPLSFLNRECTKQYQIPDTDVVLEKGTKILISLMGLQRDPEHFPDPERFDPDRFSVENKAKIAPFTYMPFGDGHRVCIGMRFGRVQNKICLGSLLSKFKFSINSNSILPIEYRSTSFVLSLKEPILLNAEKV